MERWPSLAVAAGGAIAGAIAGAALDQPLYTAASAVLAGSMAAIAQEDRHRFRVPDSWNLFAALAGFVAIWLASRSGGFDARPSLALAALQMALCGGALFLLREVFFRLRGVDGLGLGDVKLAATAGIWLGWELFAVAVLLASGSALVFVALRKLRDGSWERERKIPLAFHLAPAIWVCWFLSRLLSSPMPIPDRWS